MTLDDAKRVWQPFAATWAAQTTVVSYLSDETLLELDEGSREFTQTNCWWASKHAADYLGPEVRSELQRRAQVAVAYFIARFGTGPLAKRAA